MGGDGDGMGMVMGNEMVMGNGMVMGNEMVLGCETDNGDGDGILIKHVLPRFRNPAIPL